MATLKALRRRVASVKNSQKITKAMKLVSAAKLRRAQAAAESTRPFAESIDGIIGRIAARVDASKHPLLARREIKRINLVIVTSDRGLAGAFNSNVHRAAEQFVREAKAKGQDVIITAVGKRGRDYVRLKKFAPLNDFITDISSGLSYGTAELLAERLIPRFLAGMAQGEGEVVADEMQAKAEMMAAGHSTLPEEVRSENAPAPEETAMEAKPKGPPPPPVDAVVFIYTRFRSAISQVVTTQQILPMEPVRASKDEAEIDYKYEPGQKEMLDALLPRHVKMQIFRALLESVASEHGARMTAMDNASSNAADFIYRLTLQMNRARQAIITKELMEIVSGKEALEG
ncbi:MAG TPA: ATP synthase F1 subunit gamma [bacterium]|nr:ATP synthase F1 subunit gamma [bacterium]